MLMTVLAQESDFEVDPPFTACEDGICLKSGQYKRNRFIYQPVIKKMSTLGGDTHPGLSVNCSY